MVTGCFSGNLLNMLEISDLLKDDERFTEVLLKRIEQKEKEKRRKSHSR